MKPLFGHFLFLLLILAACSRKTEDGNSASYRPSEGETPAVAVEGVNLEYGALVSEIRGSGIAEGFREAWVVSETEGIIQKSYLDPGIRVSEGEALLTVDSESAVRNRNLAEQQYQTALLEYQAAEKSRENATISLLEFSRKKEGFLAAELSLATADDAYEKTSVRAPFDGAIAERSRDVGVGNYLSRGTRVARIVDDSSFRTEISVGEGQILLFKKGSAARIRGKDGRERRGWVSAVSAGNNELTGSFTVVLEWRPEADDPLKPGMTVDVSIKLDEEADRIIIPVSSMRIRGEKTFVFLDSSGVAEMSEIRTGSRLGDRVEVLEGLEAGDILLISGLASLTPGMPVRTTLIESHGES